MELLEVSLTGLQRRNRAAFVERPSETTRLEVGHKVVLRDEEGEYFAGTVVDVEERESSVRYLLHVGVRLPEEYAMARLGRAHATTAGTPDAGDMQELLDLLGEARTALARVPRQRFGS